MGGGGGGVKNYQKLRDVIYGRPLRPCVSLTQLIVLDFQELLDLTLTKVVSGYITRE
jgi:hypothetical protein